MSEIRDVKKVPIREGKPGRPKETEVHGSTRLGETPQTKILGGTDLRTGDVTILDQHSPVQDQEVEIRVHPQPETFEKVKLNEDDQ